MAISVLNEEKIFKLDAGSSSYVMAVMGGGRLIHLYYGARISDSRVKFLAQERGRGVLLGDSCRRSGRVLHGRDAHGIFRRGHGGPSPRGDRLGG